MPNYFNPHDFFDLAEELVSKNSESANRTILNRCYYSCFLRVKNECYKKKKGIDDYLHHDAAFFRVNKKDKKIGGYLNRLYAHRLVADYSLNPYETYELIRRRPNFPDTNFGSFTIDVNVTKESIKLTKKFHDYMDKRKTQ